MVKLKNAKQNAGCLEIDLSRYQNVTPKFFIRKITNGGEDTQSYHYQHYFQVYYVVKGYITHTTDFGHINLGYGDLCVIPPNFRHTINVNTANTEFYSCSFSADFVDQILLHVGTGGLLSGLFNSGEVVLLKSIPAQPQQHLQNLMNFLLYEYETKPANVDYAVKNCLASIFCMLLALLQSQEPIITDPTEKYSILHCINYVKNNFDKPLTLNDMVKLSHMQKKDFCLQFKNFSGHTFNDFLNKIRVEKALELLKDTQSKIPLTRIALMCGYENYITFYRNFIKHTGVTPADYLKLNGAEQ